MDDNLRDFLQQTSDAYIYEMLVTIFKRALPEGTIFLPMLQLARKYGMPVKNILSFISELGEWCKAHQNDHNSSALSDKDRQSLSELLSNSGFMTIGFDPNDRGDDDEKH